MIVVINGPLGIGKTQTAWALLARLGRAVLLSGDELAAIHPFDHYNQADLDYAYQTFAVVIAHHHAHGINDVVLEWVWESADQISRLQHALQAIDLPILTYRLRCDVDEIARRVRQRNRSDQAWELHRSRELAAILDAAAQHGNLGTVVDTTQRSIEQTADLIRRDIQEWQAG